MTTSLHEGQETENLLSAIAKISEMREMLTRLQWAGGYDDHERPLCPFCQSYEKKGHVADCELAAIIKI